MAEIPVPATGFRDIDALLWGWKWDINNFTVRFPTSINEYQGYRTIVGFEAFSPAQQQSIFLALSNISAFANIFFTLSDQFGAGHFRFAQAAQLDYGNSQGLHVPGQVDSAEGNPPDPSPEFPDFAQGDTWYNPTTYDDPVLGSFSYAAGLLHEFGHALGLKHGHAQQQASNFIAPTLEFNHDSQEYSVMTYRTYPGMDIQKFPQGPLEYPWTFMLADVAALQYMYGANFNANNGNTVYTFSTAGVLTINDSNVGAPFSVGPSFNGKILLTMWDGGGVDTYNLSNYADAMNIDLRPGGWMTFSNAQIAHLGDGQFARGNVANAYQYGTDTRSLIENVTTGSGDDHIWGNDANNSIVGNGGDDYVFASAGSDTINGGAGLDWVDYGVARNFVTANHLTNGNVTIQSPSGKFDTLIDVERIVFTDGMIAFDLDGNAGMAYRLYQAAFDRVPDSPGVGFWTRQLDAAAIDFLSLAAAFIGSAEFQAKYGTPATVSNNDYVTLLYQNVLNRNPDGEGFAFWGNQFDLGLTRPAMLAQFSESAENQAIVIGAIEHGIWLA